MSDEGKQDKKLVGQETLQGFKDQTRQEHKEILSEAKQFDKDARERDGMLHVKIETLIREARVYVDKLRDDSTEGLREKDRRIDKTEIKGTTLQVEVDNLKKTAEKIDPLQTEVTTLTTKLKGVEDDVKDLKAADQKSGTYDTRLVTLQTKYDALEKAVEVLQNVDEHGGVPWYARPAWITAVIGALAAGITAISLALRGDPPPQPDKKDKIEKTATENPGEDTKPTMPETPPPVP